MNKTNQSFTLEQIKAAHSKVKSGADFPAYINEIKQLGVMRYEHYLCDGHINYRGSNDYKISSAAKWPEKSVPDSGNPEKFVSELKAHQHGGSDYSTFCLQAIGSGVEKWIVDLEKMTCTYYDKTGKVVLVEKIPEL